MKLTNTQIECMIEDLSSEIIRILMEEWQYNMTQAMEIYYNSDTFERLSDPTTGLLLPKCRLRVRLSKKRTDHRTS